MGNMGSAHPLVEVNVSYKFEGNRIGDGRTDGPTDRQSESSIAPPPIFCGGGIIWNYALSHDTCPMKNADHRWQGSEAR